VAGSALLLPSLVGYAAGTLLGAAFLGMIPAALEQAATKPVMAIVLSGFVALFVLEKLALWRHCHDIGCEVHGRRGALLPQETDDFAVLLDNGYARGRAFLLNGLSASATLLAALRQLVLRLTGVGTFAGTH
jgi:zinc and cadmium transporter